MASPFTSSRLVLELVLPELNLSSRGAVKRAGNSILVPNSAVEEMMFRS